MTMTGEIIKTQPLQAATPQGVVFLGYAQLPEELTDQDLDLRQGNQSWEVIVTEAYLRRGLYANGRFALSVNRHDLDLASCLAAAVLIGIYKGTETELLELIRACALVDENTLANAHPLLQSTRGGQIVLAWCEEMKPGSQSKADRQRWKRGIQWWACPSAVARHTDATQPNLLGSQGDEADASSLSKFGPRDEALATVRYLPNQIDMENTDPHVDVDVDVDDVQELSDEEYAEV